MLIFQNQLISKKLEVLEFVDKLEQTGLKNLRKELILKGEVIIG